MRRALPLLTLSALLATVFGCGGEPAGVPARAPEITSQATAAPPPAAPKSASRADRKTKPANLGRTQLD